MNLIAAHVGGVLSLAGSKVTGNFDCSGLEVGQGFIGHGALFSGPISCVGAKTKDDLELSEGKFKQKVDFTGAEVGGALHLRSAQWSPHVTLTLRNAKINLIPALADAWAPKLDVDGLTYRGAGAADQFEHWFSKLDRYTTQPYDELASIVQSRGNGTLATAIRYSGRERERSEAKGKSWVWLTILRWLIGYGYYPQLAIFWALGLVMVGAAVMRVSGEGPRNGMPFGLAYSFDTLLPIIRLRERHYQIDLKSWARYYFYWHKIMGYVLASFLIAGISGLTK